MAFITNIPLFKNTSVGASGTAGTCLSDPVPLSDICRQGACSLAYSIGSTAATAGSTVFSYLTCSVADGTYVATGTFGTFTGIASGVVAFTPVVAPFMKIKGVSGTSAHAKVTAELNVR